MVPGTLEHTIHYVVEERLDLSAFDAEFNNEETGRRAYDPRVLLKVVLFGYARGLKGSRQLEAACRENITFMALACGQGPDHSTFAAFISGMGRERIEDLFAQVLLVCAEEGLLGGTHFAIDGCRMSSNASKEWSGKRSDLIKKRDKLRALVREAMEEHRRIDGGEDGGRGGGDRRRLERLQKKAERIERFLAENPARVGRQRRHRILYGGESGGLRGRRGGRLHPRPAIPFEGPALRRRPAAPPAHRQAQEPVPQPEALFLRRGLQV